MYIYSTGVCGGAAEQSKGSQFPLRAPHRPLYAQFKQRAYFIYHIYIY